MKKRLLITLIISLVVCLCFALVGCGTDNANIIEEQQSGSGGEDIGEVFSKGFEYNLINDDTEYEIVGIGTCVDTDIIIPETYNGKKVTVIDNNVFDGVQLKSLTISNNVTQLGAIKSSGCLESIIVKDENKVYYSQDNCLILKDGKYMILGCKNSVIPTDIAGLGYQVFEDCDSLTTIEIPTNINSIGINTFKGCVNLTSIVFKDTNGWIRVGSDNLLNSINVENSTLNATNLTEIYVDYNFYKIQN